MSIFPPRMPSSSKRACCRCCRSRGLDIDEDAVREKSQQGIDWHNPVWRHEDGSSAEW
ncbi:hypothetical protein [Halocatena pleomorpha]|uniref:hypothetical protein n=1 Tax=Halocatena pleomorpha TaxID=1785090 RepID=UPI001639B542|nr:hypothetical protein [Halocatena pleomorpha]